MKRLFSFFFLTSLVASSLSVACGDDTTDATAPPSADAGAERTRLPAPLRPAASCPVVIDTPEDQGSKHVPESTALTFTTNPPASGSHFPLWANFQEFQAPVPRGYWLHSAEHGAIVLLYKCDGAACGPIQEGLRKVRDELLTDSRCDPSVRVRVVITPDPELDVPVAAVAWGWTYKADCLDLPTLQQFARDHYAQGPEDVCASGKTTF